MSNDRKTSTENGILRQMFREAKSQGAELAIHNGYDDEYLSEFGGTEAGFIEAAREVDDVAVRVKTPSGKVRWLAWLVWGNEPYELVADANADLWEEKFPLTQAKIDKADLMEF